MLEIAKLLLERLTDGGPGAIIALLVGVIVLLIFDRHRLLKDGDKKDDKIEKIVDDYHKGFITMTEAMNSLKMVLVEIKGKL